MRERAVLTSISFEKRFRLLEDYARCRISMERFPFEVFTIKYDVFAVFVRPPNLNSLGDKYHSVRQGRAFGGIDRLDYTGVGEQNSLSFSNGYPSFLSGENRVRSLDLLLTGIL